MLGYGGTDKPQDPSEYSTQKLCADLVALLDVLGVQRVILIGHDWGAFTVGRFALWHPERLSSLVMLSVPYSPPSRKYISVEDVARLAPNLGYQADFAVPATTSEIENNLRRFLAVTFKASSAKQSYTSRGSLFKLLHDADVQKDPSVLNDKTKSTLNQKLQEFQLYMDDLGKGGMNGPLNYYRTAKHRHEEEERAGLPANLSPHLPVLFMWGTKDPTATPFVINKSRKFINKLQDVAVEGRGHWLMVEAKDEITEKVISWLRELTSPPVVLGKL
ncbi:hypothetical protein DXG01_012886 [Tephrocybe rancida]|nr:hypothetical protein DXG01_012886 [Tephrocybe rancida]